MVREFTYDLGKWHFELGPYGDWEIQQLEDFTINHVIKEIEHINLPTGGILLLVKGHKKEDLS